MHNLTVAGHLLSAWSVGITATTLFQDMGPGFTRDHPPLERRIGGILCGPLAIMSLGALCLDNRIALLAAAPFALIATLYSCAWARRWSTTTRRSLGWQAGVVGAVALLVLMLTAGPQQWNGGVVIAEYVASAGLLGGLTCLVVRSVLGVHQADVEAADSPYGLPARAVAIGLGITCLAAVETLFWVISGHSDWFRAFATWQCLSLVVPGCLVAAGHKWYPRLQRLIWSAALISALGGQAAIHAVTLYFPGLMPPAAI